MRERSPWALGVRVRVRALVAMLALAGCTAPDLTPVCPVPLGASLEQQQAAACACQSALVETPFNLYHRRQVDLLFVVANTADMVPKQQALASTFAALARYWAGGSIDYLIGVVSTDVGSWTAPDTPWPMSAGACDSFAGDDGRLQATSCLARTDGSAAAARACAELCPDRRFLPNDGRPFLAFERSRSNVPQALEPDPKTGLLIDRGPEYALRCILLLGDGGCTVSSPLESARRALSPPSDARPWNRGFLREGSLLVVVFLTDQDDCSVQADRRADNDPRTQDCAAPDAEAPARCYSLGAYRCLARSLRCAEPMNTPGRKTSCRERTDSYLEPVESYVRFFAELRPSYRRVLIGLVPLPAIDEGGPVVAVQSRTIAGTAGLQSASGPDAGCQSAEDPTITGLPQLRLSRFLIGLLGGRTDRYGTPAVRTSVCDLKGYESELSPLTRQSLIRPVPQCLPGLPRLRDDGSPACTVGYVPEGYPYSSPPVTLPPCAARCCDAYAVSYYGLGSLDPQIAAACADEPADCYCAVADRGFSCRNHTVFGVWHRDNGEPPPGMAVSARCAVRCPGP